MGRSSGSTARVLGLKHRVSTAQQRVLIVIDIVTTAAAAAAAATSTAIFPTFIVLLLYEFCLRSSSIWKDKKTLGESPKWSYLYRYNEVHGHLDTLSPQIWPKITPYKMRRPAPRSLGGWRPRGGDGRQSSTGRRKPINQPSADHRAKPERGLPVVTSRNDNGNDNDINSYAPNFSSGLRATK